MTNQRLKIALGKILNIGKHHSDDPRVQNCIVITNAILLFGIVLTAVISLELFRTFSASLLLMNAGYVLVFCGMFAANHRGWHLFTRVSLMVISCGSMIVISRLYGHAMGHQNFAYAVLISSLVLFSSGEVRWIGFTAVLAVLCYGYIEFFGRHWLGTT